MKVYRASYRDNYSEHQGYEYFASKAEAAKAQNKNNKQRQGGEEAQTFDEVTEIEFKLSKKGILTLLNAHASYADNG